jgi:anti-sigma regulatory factor (Ser/Thr protein kinase)
MTSTAENLHRTYPSVALSARSAREFVVAELCRVGAGQPVIDDLGLVVSELVANAIQHGDGGAIDVRLDSESPECVAVTVGNGVASRLPLMDPAGWKVAPADQRSGRGLGIVRQLADDIAVALVSGRLEITCRRQL